MTLKKLGTILILNCLFAANVGAAISGEAGYIEPFLAGDPNVVWYSGYETAPTWQPSWGIEWGPSPAGNFSIATTNTHRGNYAARVKYPQGLESTSGSGTQYRCILSNMQTISIPAKEALYVRYYVRFDPNFDFVLGGKLPGLCGAACNTGGGMPTGADGWSARIMWRAGGKVVQYMYYMDQASFYGDDFSWNEGTGGQRYLIPGQWHCLETYIQMNTPGVQDGIVRSWFDGQLSLNRTNIRFRAAGYSNIKIDKLYFSTFFGGAGAQWAPIKDEYANFDDFVLSEAYIGPFVAQTPTYTRTPNPSWSRTFTPTISSTPTTTPTADPNCFNSALVWLNNSFAAQTGTFTYVVSARPSATDADTILGLTNGPASAFTSIAACVRFSPAGFIDIRNGGAYAAAASIPYLPGTNYSFRFVVNVASHTYSAYVTPEGGAETTIGLNYAFRTEQAGVTQLNNLTANTASGTTQVCNFGISTGQTPTRTATAPQPSRTMTATFTAVNTNTSTPVPTGTYTRTPANTATRSNTVTMTATNSHTSTLTPVNTVTPSRTVTASVTLMPSNTFTITQTPAGTPPSATFTYTPVDTVMLTVTNSRTTTQTPVNTATPTKTVTMTASVALTQANTFTITQTPTGTQPAAAPIYTVTATSTVTLVSTQTNTAVNTATLPYTTTATRTFTSTRTQTPSFTRTAVNTATRTATPSYTLTRTSTIVSTAISTLTITPTNTQVPTATIAWGEKFEIPNTLIYPNPCNPEYMDLKMKITLTQAASEMKIRIYTVGYRRIMETACGALNEKEVTVTIPRAGISHISAGTYYVIAEGKSISGQKAVSKPRQLIILK